MAVPGHTWVGPEITLGRSGTLLAICWQRLVLVRPQLLVLVKQILPPPVAFTVMELLPCPLTAVMVVGSCQLKVAPGIGSTVNVVVPTFGHNGVPVIGLGTEALLTVIVIGTQVVVPHVPDART